MRWIRQRAARDFPQDLALVLHYGSSATGTAGPGSDVDCCFVPRTADGLRFARTFVIDEVGHDIFPMSWQRLERIADLGEPLEPLVGDSVLLFAASPQNHQRLQTLRCRLSQSLADPRLRHARAVENLETAATRLARVSGSIDPGRIRTAAGLSGLDLAHAVALANGTYFHHGPKGILNELQALPHLPDMFLPRLTAVLTTAEPAAAMAGGARLLQATAAFLDVPPPPIPAPRPGTTEPAPETPAAIDPQSLAHLYEEICSSFVKVKNRCASGNAVQAAIDALLLQRILDEDVPTGVALPNLMEALDPDSLGDLMARVDVIDAALLHAITDAGGQIERYRDLNTFLHANP